MRLRGTAMMRKPLAFVRVPKRKGARVEIQLTCGHVLSWKESRIKSYRPSRFRCNECGDFIHKFFDDATAAKEIGRAHV